jgi:hypothetical protein
VQAAHPCTASARYDAAPGLSQAGRRLVVPSGRSRLRKSAEGVASLSSSWPAPTCGQRRGPGRCASASAEAIRSGREWTANPLMAPAQYNFLYSSQGRPCGRPPAALRPGDDTTATGEPTTPRSARPAQPSRSADLEVRISHPSTHPRSVVSGRTTSCPSACSSGSAHDTQA